MYAYFYPTTTHGPIAGLNGNYYLNVLFFVLGGIHALAGYMSTRLRSEFPQALALLVSCHLISLPLSCPIQPLLCWEDKKGSALLRFARIFKEPNMISRNSFGKSLRTPSCLQTEKYKISSRKEANALILAANVKCHHQIDGVAMGSPPTFLCVNLKKTG